MSISTKTYSTKVFQQLIGRSISTSAEMDVHFKDLSQHPLKWMSISTKVHFNKDLFKIEVRDKKKATFGRKIGAFRYDDHF